MTTNPTKFSMPLPPNFPKYPDQPGTPGSTPTGGLSFADMFAQFSPQLPQGFPNYPRPPTAPTAGAAGGGAMAAGGSAQAPVDDYWGMPGFAGGGAPNPLLPPRPPVPGQQQQEGSDFKKKMLATIGVSGMAGGMAAGGSPHDPFEMSPAPEGGSNFLRDFYEYLDRESQAMAQEYKGKSGKQLAGEVAYEAIPTMIGAMAGPGGMALTKAVPAIGRAALKYPKTFGMGEGLGVTGAIDASSALLRPQAASAQGAGGEGIPTELPTSRDAIMQVQRQLRAKGHQIKVDGTAEGETRKAFNEYWSKENARKDNESKLELEKTKAGAAAKAEETRLREQEARNTEAATRGKEADARQAEQTRLGLEGERRATARAASEAEIKKTKESRPWYDPNYLAQTFGAPLGYLVGAGTGIGGRMSARGFANKRYQNRADRADKVIEELPKDDLKKIGPLNQFYTEGQPPALRGINPTPEGAFLTKTTPPTPNPNLPSQGQLYNPQRGRDLGTDAAMMGAGAAEYGYGEYVMLPAAKAEYDAAFAAYEKTPSKSTMDRLLAAENDIALAHFVSNMGRTGGITYGLSMPKLQRSPVRPERMGEAESEVLRINQRLATGDTLGPKARAKRAPKAQELDTAPERQQIDPSKMTTPAGQGGGGGFPRPQAGESGGQGQGGQGFPEFQSRPSRDLSSFASPAVPPDEPLSKKKAAAMFRSTQVRPGKKKPAPEPEKPERRDGGSVHYSNFQVREKGQFAGPPVYPGSGDDASGVNFPAYDDGGTVGERAKAHAHDKGRRPGESWFGNAPPPADSGLSDGMPTGGADGTRPSNGGQGEPGYMPRVGWMEMLLGAITASQAARPGASMPIRGRGLEPSHINMGDIPRATQQEAAAMEKGFAAFDKMEPGYPKRVFDPGIEAGRPATPPLYEGEMFVPSLPAKSAHYPSYDHQAHFNTRGAGFDGRPMRDSKNRPANENAGNPSYDSIYGTQQKMESGAIDKTDPGPPGQIPDNPYTMAKIEQDFRKLGETPNPSRTSESLDIFGNRVGIDAEKTKALRERPDYQLTKNYLDKTYLGKDPTFGVIEGGKPPPRGPFEPEGRAEGGPPPMEGAPPPPRHAQGMDGPPPMPGAMPGQEGPPVGGPIHGESPGRADDKPISVTSGSYVIPADVVSALGEGNTNAGMRKLQQSFPHDAHDQGGSQQMGPPVPIKISDGEYVITPDQVMELGGGDINQGHRILDRLVQQVRQQHIKNLKSMPPPAKG